MLTIQNLTTGYHASRGYIKIQQDINGTLCGGELTCLLGPNGAGKTTLLRTLSGFLPPLAGSVLVDGMRLQSLTQAELSKKISVVLTERPSVSSMTVEQLIALGRSPYTGFWGRLTDRDRHVIDDAIRLTDTESLRDRLVDTLSDGERQKVMIAKALAQETPVIFLDEPTAFLDYPSKADMFRLLKRLAKDEGKVIFLSTHDLNMALTLADKLWLADRQRGVTIGTPRNLADDGSLADYFLRPGLVFDASTISFAVTP